MRILNCLKLVKPNLTTRIYKFLIFWSIWKMKYDMKYVLTQDKILFPMVHSQAI